jgi:hypothetical protein
MNRESFRNHAAPIPVQINGTNLTALPKEFSTRSLGWNINQKLDLPVNGETVRVQVGLNLTIVGSKEMA